MLCSAVYYSVKSCVSPAADIAGAGSPTKRRPHSSGSEARFMMAVVMTVIMVMFAMVRVVMAASIWTPLAPLEGPHLRPVGKSRPQISGMETVYLRG